MEEDQRILQSPITIIPHTSPITTTTSSDEAASEEKPTTVKHSKPFKIFPKDSKHLPVEIITHETSSLAEMHMAAYEIFRNTVLLQMQMGNNINKSSRQYQVPTDRPWDPKYLEKRRKNNEASRKSREARRLRQDGTVVRYAFLEQENMYLKLRLAELEKEMSKLQSLL